MRESNVMRGLLLAAAVSVLGSPAHAQGAKQAAAEVDAFFKKPRVVEISLEIPPADYDVIQPPRFDESVNIVSPELFSEVGGTVEIEGTAAGEDFVSYRIVVGRGLNPRRWIQVAEGNEPVTNDTLAEWNTDGLSGLYAVQLQVIRSDQRLDTAIIQVTVK